MKSIRRQLSFNLCFAIGSLLILSGGTVFVAVRHALVSQFHDTLSAKAQAIVAAAEADDNEIDIDMSVKDFAGFGRSIRRDFYEIRTSTGDVIERSPSLFRLERLAKLPRPGEEAEFHRLILPDGEMGRGVAQPFVLLQDRSYQFRDIHIVVASQSETLDKQIQTLAAVLITAGGAGMLITLPLVRFALSRGLRPVDAMAQQASAIRADTLSSRFEISHLPRELQPVAQKLNDLLARLEEAFERERRFSGHVAHELRTPLAELRAITELMATWPEEATPEHLNELLLINHEMEDLVGKLTELARAESGHRPVQRENVSLETSVNGVIERMEGEAEARDVYIDSAIRSGPFVTDPVLWSGILTNLIGNAVRHAPSQSRIDVNASPEKLKVSNTAPTLTPDDVGKLFERFWRKDESRTGYGHAGLGLSLVRAFAELLGGKVKAELTEGVLIMEVEWPPYSE